MYGIEFGRPIPSKVHHLAKKASIYSTGSNVSKRHLVMLFALSHVFLSWLDYLSDDLLAHLQPGNCHRYIASLTRPGASNARLRYIRHDLRTILLSKSAEKLYDTSYATIATIAGCAR